jgi:hypothetical protein
LGKAAATAAAVAGGTGGRGWRRNMILTSSAANEERCYQDEYATPIRRDTSRIDFTNRVS